MFRKLVRLSNYLDSKGFIKESNYLHMVIRKIASDEAVDGHFITESYPIEGSDGLCQVVLDTGEQYVFTCAELPAFAPGNVGNKVSADDIDLAIDDDALKGDSTYQDTQDFLKEEGYIAPASESDIPEGAVLVTSISNSEGTTCHYNVNGKRITRKAPHGGDCLNNGKIRVAPLGYSGQ